MARATAWGMLCWLLSAAPASAQAADPPAADLPPARLDRIRSALAAPAPIRESLGDPDAIVPTFRIGIQERPFDIWEFWGTPDDAVAAYVRPWVGGTWHHEFQQMVTPDEFKGFGTFGNAERLQLVATQLAFGTAMALARAGVESLRAAARERERAKAREEVRRALEEFYRAHPEARPPAAPPPSPAVPPG